MWQIDERKVDRLTPGDLVNTREEPVQRCTIESSEVSRSIVPEKGRAERKE